MKKLKEYGFDDQLGLLYIKKYLLLKNKTEDTLDEHYDEEIVNSIKTAKSGYMSIEKISDNPGYLLAGETQQGWCGLFNVGLSCILMHGSRWYHTSLIKDIDWDNNIFHTENSTYKFHLDEYSSEELLNYINNDSSTNN